MSLREKIINLEPVDLFEYKDEIFELRDLELTEQNPKWHAEGNVLIHTNMALKEARPLALKVAEESGNINNGISIYIGTLLHDFGKPYTTFKKDNGRIVAYGHESQGVAVARDFLRKYFPDFGYPRREWLLSLVEYHGHPKRMIKDGSKDVKFKKLSLDVNTEQVYNVEVADFTGRLGESPDKSLHYLEQFKSKCKELDVWDKKYEIPNSEFISKHVYKSILWDILFNNKDENDKKFILSKLDLMGEPPFELMILIGAPASGKTTYRKTFYPHIDSICMDDERERLCGTQNDMSKNQAVFDNCFKKLCSNMKARKNTIWDATSIGRKIRKRLINVARQHGALVTFVVFDLPINELHKRNSTRDKEVPNYVIDKFYYSMQTPKAYEYDTLKVVNENSVFPGVKQHG